MPMKNSNDTIGNWSRDLPVCSTVPQPLRHRVPPKVIYRMLKILILKCLLNTFHSESQKISREPTIWSPKQVPPVTHYKFMSCNRNENEDIITKNLFYTFQQKWWKSLGLLLQFPFTTTLLHAYYPKDVKCFYRFLFLHMQISKDNIKVHYYGLTLGTGFIGLQMGFMFLLLWIL
jgi:hypothetical protein